MTKLATKSTPKRKKSKNTAKKLDHLIESVKSKPVFVVGIEEKHYTVVDYIKKEAVVSYVPTRELAERIRDRYNKKRPFPKQRHQEITDVLRHSYRIHNDIVFYEHFLANIDDNDRKVVARIRRLDAMTKQKALVKELYALI